jgi:hypothetical protein
LSAVLLVVLSTVLTYARNAGPSDREVQDMARGMGMDPQQCDALQNRINQVVAIYESSLSDNEKLAGLSEYAAQSMAEMQQAGSKDAEVEQAVNQHLVLMQSIMSAAKASASADDKKVSDAAKDDVQKLKILTKTYVDMMKSLCPKLALPEVVTK